MPGLGAIFERMDTADYTRRKKERIEADAQRFRDTVTRIIGIADVGGYDDDEAKLVQDVTQAISAGGYDPNVIEQMNTLYENIKQKRIGRGIKQALYSNTSAQGPVQRPQSASEAVERVRGAGIDPKFAAMDINAMDFTSQPDETKQLKADNEKLAQELKRKELLLKERKLNIEASGGQTKKPRPRQEYEKAVEYAQQETESPEYEARLHQDRVPAPQKKGWFGPSAEEQWRSPAGEPWREQEISAAINTSLPMDTLRVGLTAQQLMQENADITWAESMGVSQEAADATRQIAKALRAQVVSDPSPDPVIGGKINVSSPEIKELLQKMTLADIIKIFQYNQKKQGGGAQKREYNVIR